MSAYICNPEHFGILAAFAVAHDVAIYEWQHISNKSYAGRLNTAQRVAKGLARENIRSVKHLYPDAGGDLPGPCLAPTDIEEAAAIYAAHFVTNPIRLSPVQVFKLVQGIDYQSCETDDWPMTLAARQLSWITNEAVRQLPGYEASNWSYERPIPEIEALYERS